MELKEIIDSFQTKKRDMLLLYNEKLPLEERAGEIELTTYNKGTMSRKKVSPLCRWQAAFVFIDGAVVLTAFILTDSLFLI